MNPSRLYRALDGSVRSAALASSGGATPTSGTLWAGRSSPSRAAAVPPWPSQAAAGCLRPLPDQVIVMQPNGTAFAVKRDLLPR